MIKEINSLHKKYFTEKIVRNALIYSVRKNEPLLAKNYGVGLLWGDRAGVWVGAAVCETAGETTSGAGVPVPRPAVALTVTGVVMVAVGGGVTDGVPGPSVGVAVGGTTGGALIRLASVP